MDFFLEYSPICVLNMDMVCDSTFGISYLTFLWASSSDENELTDSQVPLGRSSIASSVSVLDTDFLKGFKRSPPPR